MSKSGKKVETNKVGETNSSTIIFKVNKPLSETEYAELAKRVRAEEEASGVKIILVPYSVNFVETEVENKVETTEPETEKSESAEGETTETETTEENSAGAEK